MKKIIILYFLGALLLSGCMRDEFDTTRVEEGIAARVSLRVLLPDMDGAVSAGNTRTSANTRAVDAAVENRLDSLRVLVFNSSGQIVTNRKYTAQSDGSLSSLQIDTWSGNNLTFCFVANSRDDLDNRLAVVTSYNDLREFMVTASSLNFGLSDTEALIMTAIVENVNVQPGSDTISDPIQLQFLAAKLTLTVTDATPDRHAVTILGWDVQDVPARSYLFPDSKDANPAPEGGADKEEYWLTTASDYPFEVVRNKSASQTLYLFENRRGERVARSLPGNPDERYPDMALDDTDHRGKAWFKPQRATAVVINAIHRAGTQSELIKAYIYLGNDNHSDYNIIRGNHYTFNITVYGINDIKIDTNVDSKAGDFFVDYSDNLRMDAHPDFRVLRMHAAGGTGTMEILDSQGRTYGDPSFDATLPKSLR